MSTAEFVVRRRLTESQQERRARILSAARELAAEGGYDAVVMRDVAERAGVALGTLYRYFASKDHLLAEVLVEWGGELEARLRRAPPRGDTPRERVLTVLRHAVREVETEPVLAAALTTALLSPDPAVTDTEAGFTTMMRRWMDLAVREEEVPDRDGVIEVLEHVFFSGMIGLVNGRCTPGDLRRQVERAARLLLSR
jgi:AcrR family transcriptional regulator